MESFEIGGSKVEITQGDITAQETEAVVNAANKRLAPGGGVAGAIHQAAGPELYEECKQLGGCKTGEAEITDGYQLPADYVIHAVGPIYSGDKKDEAQLRKSYKSSLQVALENGIKSISFPAISTGAFGYPTEDAAEVALDEIKEFLAKHGKINLVRMVLYDEEDHEIHLEKAKKIFS